MSFSRLDQVYRSILMTKFFSKGWGKPDNLKRLFEFKKFVSNRESCITLVSKDYPITITKEETCSDCKIIEGQFLSPFSVHLPGIMPKEAETAYFQIILPKKWNSDHYKPICLHLAGTGDHGFWRRRQLMAKPLLKQSGIGAILLENPFYGLRKPKDQVRSNLHNVSDIFVMGGCLILESLALFHWCERVGLGPLGITGLSMGGHMASLAATNWPKPIALVPCLSWSTASLVFTEGVLSHAINWALLDEQYNSDRGYQHEIQKYFRNDESAFQAGQHFAKNYPKSMERVNELGQTNRLKEANSKNEEGTIPLPKPSSQSSVQGVTNKESKGSKLSTEVEEKSVDVATVITKSTSETTSSKIIKKSRTILLKLFSVGKKEKSIVTDFSVSKSRLVKETVDGDHTKTVVSSKIRIKGGKSSKDGETLHFMRGIMDECTHLRNYDVPVDTSLIIAICAKDDAYVPREGCAGLTDIWPGAEVRFLNSGHVGAFLMHHNIFRGAIIESFERLKKKYPATNAKT